MTSTYKKKYYARVFVNALVMLAISLYLLNQPVVHEDEKAMIEYTAALKAELFGGEQQPDSNMFLFINVSNDKELIAVPNELQELGFIDFASGTELSEPDSLSVDATATIKPAAEAALDNDWDDLFADEPNVEIKDEPKQKIDYPFGNEPITNRALLAQFFKILNKHSHHKYVVCDVMFEGKSPNNAALEAEITKVPRLIVPSWLNDQEKEEAPIFDVNYGLASYTAVDDFFVKFNLLEDTIRTLPLKLYEALHKDSLEQGPIFAKMKGKSVFQNFVLNYRIQNEDVISPEGKYNSYYWKYLSTSLFMNSEEEIAAMTRDKIIVIADFENEKNDYHDTPQGEIAGGLILINTYLALVNGDNRIHPALYLILFIGFLLVSMVLWHPSDLVSYWMDKQVSNIEAKKQAGEQGNNKLMRLVYESDITEKIREQLTGFAQSIFNYLVLLVITSLVAYFLLNNHISIFYMTLYIAILEPIIGVARWVKERRSQNSSS